MADRAHGAGYRSATTLYDDASPGVELVAIADVNQDFADVLDDRFGRVAPDDPGAVGLGKYALSGWPQNSSWGFVAVGRGHGVEYWGEFLQALQRVAADMAVQQRARGPGARPVRRAAEAAETLRRRRGRTRGALRCGPPSP
jgi:hypothetical protein